MHLNPAGHTVLENIVIQKNIFFSPVAITFGGFSTSQQNGKVKLTWYSEPLSVNDYFCVQRAADNNEFQTISYVNGNLQNYKKRS